MSPADLFNPFPGLRPFEAEEDHLFFGREKGIDELLRRLRSTRFLSVVGASGSGKSSLVRCGLISALHSGFMVGAGSTWRVAMFRPSEDPIGNLAAALNARDVLGTEGEQASTNRVLLEATLSRGTLGLVDAVLQARIPPDENVLVVVDQFEELFRFRRSRKIQNYKDEATAFVKLLLEGANQDEAPIYIVLTMRSDFIGDCMEYAGLPEAVNEGQYLVPRLTRDELRSAITGPVAVGGGEIAPRLVVRLLNDLGNNQDQLPVLQHALMRSWEYWEQHRQPGEPIDIAHYEAVGTLRNALSLHAEEAYLETDSDRGRQIAERMFKALTTTFSDPRGVRRPTSVQDLTAICEVPESEVIRIIEIFRRPGRSFLMPPANVPLDSQSIMDLSHESLMRGWTRLIGWAEEEKSSAESYVRLAQAASWFEEGTAGLWRDPELEFSLQWKQRNRPTAAWAERYDPSFARAMDFLERSERERNRVSAEREKERKRKLRQVQWAACVLWALLVVAVFFAYLARKENVRAEQNQALAQQVGDGMLSLMAGGEAEANMRGAPDTPETEEFRKEALEKSRRFYTIFATQNGDIEAVRKGTASAHYRLGAIDRVLRQTADAEKKYKEAATEYGQLARDHPGKAEYRQALANCYNGLGVTLGTSPEAGKSYESALILQQELVRDNPENTQYRQELARTHYNRGILRYSANQFVDSDSDFREAIRLLKPLSEKAAVSATQELARVYNNLANNLWKRDRLQEAREFFELAIRIHDGLVQTYPDNREYKQELATFSNNLAMLLAEQRHYELAEKNNRRALDLIEELTKPAFLLQKELARAHNFRCQMLESQGLPEAETECQHSMDFLHDLAKVQANRDREGIHGLFLDLGYNYLELAKKRLASGSMAKAQAALENLSRLLPEIPEPHRKTLHDAYVELRHGSNNGTATHK